MTQISPKKARKIAANNKRVAAIREQCDRLTTPELIKKASRYKEEYF